MRAVLFAILALGLGLSLSRASEQGVPSFNSLHLEKWSPRNDFRPVRDLRVKGATLIGFNEEFIWGYMQSSGVRCDDCATNSPPVSLEVARSYLDLLSEKGVRIAREIVPERYIAEPSNDSLVEAVLKEYQKHDLTLIVALAWPTTEPNNKCFGFEGSDRDFDRTAYDNSAAIARLLLSLGKRENLDRQWLATHILIEPWNEFDALCVKKRVGSPEKAARYQGILQLVFDRAGLKNEITTPSFVDAYSLGPFPATAGRYGNVNSYLDAYYRAGGSGRPTIHLYFDPHWEKQEGALAEVLEDETERDQPLRARHL